MLTIIQSVSSASQSYGETDLNSIDRYNKALLQMAFVFHGFGQPASEITG